MADNKNYIALEATSQEIAGTVATLYEIESKLTAEKVGQTNNSGGTAKEGTIFAKLNRIQNLLLGYDGVFQAKCSANSKTVSAKITKGDTDTEKISTLINIDGSGIVGMLSVEYGMGVIIWIDGIKIIDCHASDGAYSNYTYFGNTGGDDSFFPLNHNIKNDHSEYYHNLSLMSPLVFSKSLKVQYFNGAVGSSKDGYLSVFYGIGGAAQ